MWFPSESPLGGERAKTMETILIALDPGTLSSDQLARVRETAPDGTPVVMTRDWGAMRGLLDRVEVVAGWFPARLLPQAPELRWYQQWSAGADWLLDHPEAAEADFVLTSTSGIHAIPVTEHVFALLLAFARELPRALRSQDQHQWIPYSEHEELFELSGRTMLLVGVGAIGARIAHVAAAMGMRVLGVRRDPTLDSPGVDRMAGPDDIVSLLPEADMVVLTVPLTEETEGMIGERELLAMKESAILVNVGRGGTIDEAALARALREGKIAGAALDVWETEPLPTTSPLWDLDNMIITAHYAGATPHYHERALNIFLDNLRRYIAGKPLRNAVDKDLGY